MQAAASSCTAVASAASPEKHAARDRNSQTVACRQAWLSLTGRLATPVMRSGQQTCSGTLCRLAHHTVGNQVRATRATHITMHPPPAASSSYAMRTSRQRIPSFRAASQPPNTPMHTHGRVAQHRRHERAVGLACWARTCCGACCAGANTNAARAWITVPGSSKGRLAANRLNGMHPV